MPEGPSAAAAAVPHPVRLVLFDDRRRSRLTALFRLPLAFPHIPWLLAWTVLALVSGLVNWLATLALGRSPRRLHAFLAAHLRYLTHVLAFLLLVANPFPGFVGKAGSYPVDLEVDAPERRKRWKTLLRLVLLCPTLVLLLAVTAIFFGLLYPLSFVTATVSSLLLGRVPEGVRNLVAFLIRYEAQGFAYALGVSMRFPYTGPFYGTPPYV